MRLRTVCVNQRGEEVLGGEALVMPSRTPVRYDVESAATWTALPWTWAADSVAAVNVLGLVALSSAMSWWLPRGLK